MIISYSRHGSWNGTWKRVKTAWTSLNNVIKKYRDHNPSQAFLHLYISLCKVLLHGIQFDKNANRIGIERTESTFLAPEFGVQSMWISTKSRNINLQHFVDKCSMGATGRHFPWSCPDFVCSNCAWFQSFTMRYWGSKTVFPCPNYFNPNDWPKTLKEIQRPAKQLLSLQGDLADWYAKQGSYHN